MTLKTHGVCRVLRSTVFWEEPRHRIWQCLRLVERFLATEGSNSRRLSQKSALRGSDSGWNRVTAGGQLVSALQGAVAPQGRWAQDPQGSFANEPARTVRTQDLVKPCQLEIVAEPLKLLRLILSRQMTSAKNRTRHAFRPNKRIIKQHAASTVLGRHPCGQTATHNCWSGYLVV